MLLCVLAFHVYKQPEMKLGSCCREIKMQLSCPTLRSLANFYIELEQFCCSLSAVKVCIWNIRPGNISPGFKCFSKLHSWPTVPHLVVCVDHDLVRILYQKQYIF